MSLSRRRRLRKGEEKAARNLRFFLPPKLLPDPDPVYMKLDLTADNVDDRIAYPIPWTIEARLYDDDSYGTGIIEYCTIDYTVLIYPRIGFDGTFRD